MKFLTLLVLAFLPTLTAAQVIKLDGSSTVFPISEAVAEEFQKATRTRVTVGISGTGGGFKKFCRGEIDISNASRPILRSEIEACRLAGIQFIELPIAYDALTVVVSSRNTWLRSITIAELKKMWEPAAQGTIRNWRQVNPLFPDAPLKLYGPGADSGTFDYFTEAVVGRAKSSRGDFTASEDDNVLVQGISRDVNAIGYFGFAYYNENRDKLRAVAVVPHGSTAGVLPSEATVIDGTYQPLSRPIFIYINVQSLSNPGVRQFVDFYMSNAENLIVEVKYVPLPRAAYVFNKHHIEARTTGTRFGGENQVGMTIEQLMKIEAK